MDLKRVNNKGFTPLEVREYRQKCEKNKLLTGFTLIELLVVIAIITLLSSIVFVGVQGLKAKARDARRISDLYQIRTALSLYYTTYGNWIEFVGSCTQNWCSCGASGTGIGGFNYDYYPTDPYKESIAQCLINAGFTSEEIIDPTGGRSSTATSGYTYMKYHCIEAGQKVVYIYAKLESKIPYPPDQINAPATCCFNCGTANGMNYYLRIQ